VLGPGLKHEARGHRRCASLRRPYEVYGIHVEPIFRVRRKPQLDRICLTAGLPQIDPEWSIRGGCVPDICCGVALVAAVSIPNERPPRRESKPSLPVLKEPPPAADRYGGPVNSHLVEAYPNRDDGGIVAPRVPDPHGIVVLGVERARGDGRRHDNEACYERGAHSRTFLTLPNGSRLSCGRLAR